MNALEFTRNPPGGTPCPIYAVFGDDDYLKSESVGAIIRVAFEGKDGGMGLSRVPGSQAELADVLDELRTLPFLAKRRVVVVEDADPFVTAYRKELETYLEKPSSTGVLVLVVKSWPSNTRLAKLVSQIGVAVDAKAPKESELPSWMVQMAKARWGQKLEAEAARLLLDLVGPEPGLLASELEKLSVAVSPNSAIRAQDVSRWVSAGRMESIWETLDAATLGRTADALEGLERLIEAGEPPVKLYSAMSASLLKLYHSGYLRALRRELRQACQEAGIPPFAAEKAGRQHAHLGPARVSAIPSRLLQADLDLKGSSMLDPRAQLERLLIELAAPRTDG